MMQVKSEVFGTLPTRETAYLYTLEGRDGFRVKVSSFGGIVTSIQAPDREGRVEEIVLGFDTLEEYASSRFYFGAAIGRFGNRIAGGRFLLEGEEFSLLRNNGANHLHGGGEGALDRKNWGVSPFASEEEAGLVLTAFSPDGEEGYPGNLTVTMIYRLSRENVLSFEYRGVSDRATPVNLTNHSYFNLGGIANGSVREHRVRLACPWFLPVDEALIPTGEILSVKGTPMDFLEEHSIGERLDAVPGGGYDHCYVTPSGEGMRPFARVEDPASGRVMEAATDQPGVQFYTGNFLEGVKGSGGCRFDRNWGFCLETQLFPDSPNRPHFPSPILRPGQVYTHKTSYAFSVS